MDFQLGVIYTQTCTLPSMKVGRFDVKLITIEQYEELKQYVKTVKASMMIVQSNEKEFGGLGGCGYCNRFKQFSFGASEEYNPMCEVTPTDGQKFTFYSDIYDILIKKRIFLVYSGSHNRDELFKSIDKDLSKYCGNLRTYPIIGLATPKSNYEFTVGRSAKPIGFNPKEALIIQSIDKNPDNGSILYSELMGGTNVNKSKLNNILNQTYIVNYNMYEIFDDVEVEVSPETISENQSLVETNDGGSYVITNTSAETIATQKVTYSYAAYNFYLKTESEPFLFNSYKLKYTKMNRIGDTVTPSQLPVITEENWYTLSVNNGYSWYTDIEQTKALSVEQTVSSSMNLYGTMIVEDLFEYSQLQ